MKTLQDAVADAWFALRMMRKSALATATIVLCLGFSIGATAAVVAWMEGLVLRPVRGVPELDRLISLKSTAAGGVQSNLSYPDYRDIVGGEAGAGARPFGALAAFGLRRFNVRTTAEEAGQHAEPVWGILASANYFEVLRVRPALGRGFLAGEDSAAGREPVAVISHALWRRRFASDPAVLGRRVWVNDRELTVVGVAPPDFTGTISGLAFDIWVPVTMHAALADNPGLLDDRVVRWLGVFGRLAPGASLASANTAAGSFGARLSAAYAEDRDRGLRARTLDVGPTERLAPLFVIMLGITILVLLIVCTNVANLLLLRGAARQHELAVRLALGAGSGRVIRQLMTESLLLAVGGLGLGLAVGAWGQRALGARFPESPLPVVVDTPLDVRVVLLLAAVSVGTVFLFGLAPALRTTRAAGRVSLTGGTRGATAAGARVRGVLVGAQFALSLVVLVLAGLFLRRLDELQRVDRGFHEPERVVVATLDFGLAGVRGDSARRQLVEQLVQRVAALPGARSAAAASFVPLGMLGYSSMDVRVDGYAPRPGESMTFLMNRVSAGYFETMGTPMVRGRAITAADREGAEPVVVVNEAFARRFWGDGEPVGRRVRVGPRELTVVGVAADGKYEFTAPLDDPSPPFVYVPFAQWGYASTVLHVRADGDPLALLPAIRREVEALSPGLPVLSPTTLETYTSVPLFPIRLGSSVLTMLGAAALLLAALGLYAVIGYAVAQRRREIGVRMALGATPRRLVASFVGDAGRYVGTGALAGFVLAVLAVAVLQRGVPYIVPHIGAGRTMPFVLAFAVLAPIAFLAALVPAVRAAGVSPTVALREE